MHPKTTVLALISFAMLGCGGGLKEFPTAQVSGKVLCEGQPVANVRVNFAPMGKPGAKAKAETGRMGEGITGADGTFTVSTYGDGDGAVIGKHRVSVSPPHSEDYPGFKCNCATYGNKQPIIDVDVTVDGENDFTIELPSKTAAVVVEAKPLTPKQLDEMEDARRSAEEEPQ